MTLSNFIPSYLGEIYNYLAWSSTQVDFIISETLEFLNITAEDDVDSKTLHAVAKIKSLEQALKDLSTSFKFSGDGVNVDTTNVYEQVKENLANAHASYQETITVGTIEYKNDPYDLASYEGWYL